ncbi:cell surface A33 antigen isoform X2 [Rhinatrema bivittatum]|uniref:cell surface A33 antigen isoform X2 n=1 Tax=Rhinatrema bivittatum TaxID=194408 RepID=UPI00112E51D1|nr:cell surface A33 antigen isoform X2 [Rhinatrema bivittatum]
MRKSQRLTFFALCTVLATAFAIQVKTPPKLEAARGRNVTLSCSYETTVTDRNAANIQWKKILPTQEEVISYFFGSSSMTTTGDSYKDRTAFTGKPDTNDATITISQLTMEDNGTYQCELTIPQDRKGHTFSNVDLLILVAPSKPECAIVGTAEYGQDIQLTCASREGSPVPTYAWQSFTPQNQLRQLPQTAVIAGGQVTLKNISAETSGFYICTATNKIAKDSCNITVAVIPQKEKKVHPIPKKATRIKRITMMQMKRRRVDIISRGVHLCPCLTNPKQSSMQRPKLN